MARGRLKFRQADVARALRAIKQAGAAMAIEITPNCLYPLDFWPGNAKKPRPGVSRDGA